MLRGPAVGHGQHGDVSGPRQPTADAVVRVQVTQDEAASVEVDDQRARPVRRPVQAQWQAFPGAQVPDLCQLRTARAGGCPLPGGLAQASRTEGPVRRAARLADLCHPPGQVLIREAGYALDGALA
jgi:hypothetical protein